MQNSDFTIRKANENDVNVLVDNRIDFLLEIQGEKSEEELVNLRKELTDYFARTLKTGEFIAFLAEKDNKPVSFSGLVIQCIPPSFSITKGSLGYILNMYTQKDFRGYGLCTVLMKKLMDTALELNIQKLYLNATNEGYGLYKKLGFHSPEWVELEWKQPKM